MHSLPYPTASCTMCYRMTHNTYLVTMAFKAKCITTISFLLRCRRLTLTQCFAKYDLRLIPESPQCTVLYYELISWYITPHQPGCLVFLRPLPNVLYTSHQYMEDLHWFKANFKIFGQVVFEAIEVKGHLMLNFEVTPSKFCNYFWKFGCQPWKSKADICMTKGYKVLIYLT